MSLPGSPAMTALERFRENSTQEMCAAIDAILGVCRAARTYAHLMREPASPWAFAALGELRTAIAKIGGQFGGPTPDVISILVRMQESTKDRNLVRAFAVAHNVWASARGFLWHEDGHPTSDGGPERYWLGSFRAAVGALEAR